MPTARKLTDEEVEQLTRGRGPVDLTLYAAAPLPRCRRSWAAGATA